MQRTICVTTHATQHTQRSKCNTPHAAQYMQHCIFNTLKTSPHKNIMDAIQQNYYRTTQQMQRRKCNINNQRITCNIMDAIQKTQRDATQQMQRGKCSSTSNCTTSNAKKRMQNNNAQMLRTLCICAHINNNNGCGMQCPCQISTTHQPLMRCWCECHFTFVCIYAI